MNLRRFAGQFLTVVAVSVFVACWVGVTLLVAAGVQSGEPVSVSVHQYAEAYGEVVTLLVVGPAIGWALRAALTTPAPAQERGA